MLLSVHCTIPYNFLYKHAYLLAAFPVSQKADLHLVIFFHFLMAMHSLNTLHIFFFVRLPRCKQRGALPQTNLLTHFFYSTQWHHTAWVLSIGVIVFSRNLPEALSPGEARSSGWFWYTHKEKQQLSVEMCLWELWQEIFEMRTCS